MLCQLSNILRIVKSGRHDRRDIDQKSDIRSKVNRRIYERRTDDVIEESICALHTKALAIYLVTLDSGSELVLG
jgi:hypothetical protein